MISRCPKLLMMPTRKDKRARIRTRSGNDNHQVKDVLLMGSNHLDDDEESSVRYMLTMRQTQDEMSIENGVNPPAPNPVHNSNFSLLLVLGRERLTSPNYMDWIRNLRFTLRYENKEYVLDEQIPIIDGDSTQEEIEAHQKHYDDANKVSRIMASSMSPELQKTFENI
ncbi:hypothetical protein Tco_1174178 [Tanacetum coccineum]